jgi:hypothetical protein
MKIWRVLNMKILSSLLFIGILFSQEPCEGTCLSEEETKSLFHNISETEYKLELCDSLVINLESQIKDYDILIGKKDVIIFEYENQLKLKDEIIKEISPKWYENRYLWFGLGVFFTSQTIKLAGEL